MQEYEASSEATAKGMSITSVYCSINPFLCFNSIWYSRPIDIQI